MLHADFLILHVNSSSHCGMRHIQRVSEYGEKLWTLLRWCLDTHTTLNSAVLRSVQNWKCSGNSIQSVLARESSLLHHKHSQNIIKQVRKLTFELRYDCGSHNVACARAGSVKKRRVSSSSSLTAYILKLEREYNDDRTKMCVVYGEERGDVKPENLWLISIIRELI